MNVINLDKDPTNQLANHYEQACSHWDAAQDACGKNNFSLADTHFKAASAKFHVCSLLDNANPFFCYQKGMCFSSLSNFSSTKERENCISIAVAEFGKAIALHRLAHPKPDVDQKCVRAMYIRDLADCLIKLNRFQAADLTLPEAVAIDPTPLSLAFLGVLKATYLGQKEKGKTLFNEAFKAAARDKNENENKDDLAAHIYADILKLGRDSGLIPPLSLVRSL